MKEHLSDGSPSIASLACCFGSRPAPAGALLTEKPIRAFLGLQCQWRLATQVLTPYEEAQCHVEAWPQYPDALMISNMIAGEALP